MILSPCKDCEERHEGCHGTCTRYLAHQIINDQRKTREHRDREIDAVRARGAEIHRRYIAGDKRHTRLSEDER